MPRVTSTLPPPMSMTTADVAGDVDAVDRGQMDEPRFFGAGDDAERMPVCAVDRLREIRRRSRLRASALVATATISSTWCDSASRLNFDSTWSAACIAVRRERAAVEAAGAQPDHFLFAVDDFERQVGPDLHHDHVDRVGADVDGGDAHAGGRTLSMARLVPLHGRYILARQFTGARDAMPAGKSYHEPRSAPCHTTLLLERRAGALKRHLPAAVDGRRHRRPPGAGRVAASARSGAGARRRTSRAARRKAERKIRRLTRALGPCVSWTSR